jgi:hypothetical protein
VEFEEAFLPWNGNAHGDKFVGMSMLTTFANIKAQLANAGNTGNCYPEFTSFTVKEVRQFLGLQMWQGLAPSLCMEMKLKLAYDNPMQGSNFLNLHMGANSIRRFKMFGAFFLCQDP